MRVSHLTLRRKMEDIKSKITDKEFFTSSLFRGYLADMADATGKRYRKPIKVIMDWDERDEADAAFTNNQSIYINAASPLMMGLSTRALKAEGIVGKLAHEVGHILFSDFEGLARFKGAFDNKPVKPDDGGNAKGDFNKNGDKADESEVCGVEANKSSSDGATGYTSDSSTSEASDESTLSNLKDFVIAEQLSILDFQEIDYDDDPQEVVSHETGRIPLEQTDEIDTSGDGGFERNREYEGFGIFVSCGRC